ncbi:MAG: stalk domain-containing protein [Bacillota bacterium]
MKKLVSFLLISLIMIASLPFQAGAAGTIALSAASAGTGDAVTVTGVNSPNAWVAVKAVDGLGNILVFDTVKADNNGAYSFTFTVPDSAGGTIRITAGYGANVASADLSVNQPSPQDHTVTLAVNQPGAGTVSGGGSYAQGADVTVTATAASGYTFVNWTESGITVSSNAAYSFVMGATDRTLTANFAAQGSGGGGNNGGGGGGGSPTPTNSASKFIKAGEGGSVRFADAAVEVPAGTLPADATLKVKQLSEKEAGDLVPSGLRVKLGSDVYEITTTGGRNFGDKTITIRIAYDPAKIAEGERPVIRYRDETTGEWIDLPTAVEQGADGKWYAVTQVNHLTKFAVFSAQVQETVKKVIVLTLGRREAAVDGSPYTLDAVPFVDTKANRTLVPIRFVSEALGAKVDWDAATRRVTIKDGGREIVLTLGSRDALVDGQTTALDCAPAVLPPGRTFVPLRFVSETLGAAVDYDPVNKRITITRF